MKTLLWSIGSGILHAMPVSPTMESAHQRWHGMS